MNSDGTPAPRTSPLPKGIDSIPEWDAFVDEEIRRNRTETFRLRVVDKEGAPLAGRSMEIQQKDLDFTLGVCPNGHVSVCNELACGTDEASDLYWEWIGELFNATTLWWGWRVTEPRPGEYAFDQACEGSHTVRRDDPESGETFWDEHPRMIGPWEAMLERARKLDHKLTGHALLYPRGDVAPRWINPLPAEEAKRHLEEVVRYTVRRYRDEVSVWHPVNENFPGLQKVGPFEIDEGEVYRWVREEAPKAELVNNGGYEIEPDFFEQAIRNADRQGVSIDTLGIRGYHELYYADDLDGYLRRWNHFNDLINRYGKWLRYTEIGANSKVARNGIHDPKLFVSGSAMNEGIVAVEPRDGKLPVLTEATQTEFLVRMYKLIFAHPAMKECSYWDLLDDFTWNFCEGGLITADRRPKLAYTALKQLFHEEWRTQTTVTTDAEGVLEFTGYRGDYEISVEGSGTIACDLSTPRSTAKASEPISLTVETQFQDA
ncbi:MAG: endo-1,4-beta-xylanase [Puniceicoccaceae bacterium]